MATFTHNIPIDKDIEDEEVASKPVVFHGKQQLIDDDDDDDVGPVPIASSPLSSGAHGAPSDNGSGMSSTSPPIVNFHASVASPEPAQAATAASPATAATPEQAGMNTASSTSTGSTSNSSTSSNSLATPAVHANGVNHRSPSPVPRPSHEQEVQESLDSVQGHSHSKPPSTIAAEGASTHLPDVNALAPWLAEAHAVQQQQQQTPSDVHAHRPHAPLPSSSRAGASPLPPLDERLAQANAAASLIHSASDATADGVPVQQAAQIVKLPSTSPPVEVAAASAETEEEAKQNGQSAAAASASASAAAASASAAAASPVSSPDSSPAPASSSPSSPPGGVEWEVVSLPDGTSRRISSVTRARLEELVRVDRWGNIRRPGDEEDEETLKKKPVSEAARRAQLAHDQERESKWVKMVSQWERTMSKRSDKVKRRIRKGIPDSMRAAVWPRFTGAWDLMRTPVPAPADGSLPRSGPGVYARYAGMYSKEQDTIQRDIARTFPNHVLFRDRDPFGMADESGNGGNIAAQAQAAAAASSGDASPRPAGAAGGGVGSAGQGRAKGEDLEGKNSMGRSALYNVLKAYSVHDPQVGYCQGMGFPAGLFLMYMSEEESFWMLASIARGERYLLNGLWSPGFPLLFQCFYQFSELLRKHCPRLSARLLAQDPPVTPELYATHWFMTSFSYNLPFDVCLRIWDILLAEGPKIVFRLAVFLCKYLEPRILATEKGDFAAVLDLLKNVHKDPLMADPDAVIEGALKVKISREELAKLADKYQAQKFAEEQQKQLQQQQKRK